MKYIVYLTTNLLSKINGQNRIYIGVHKTEDPNIFDGYIGCGVYINQPSTYKYPKTPFLYAVKKYGVSAFKRTILFIYDTHTLAYNKEAEIVDLEFIKLEHVYNSCVGGLSGYLGKTLYQFDLNGHLIKKWQFGIEAYTFYNVSRTKFNYAIQDKHSLLGYLWSTNETIDPTEYITTVQGQPKVTYLYSKNGKMLLEFISRKECSKYLNLAEITIVNAIKRNSLLLNLFYVSDKLVDIFIPKPRKQYTNTIFYIYKNYEYIGEYKGKEIMPIIQEYSWSKIREYLRNLKGWYKDFYISEVKVDKIPAKQFGNGIQVDVYDKYGTFIETIKTIKEVKKKYKVPASKIKNIQLGDRYFNDYIFKYHSNK